MDRANQSLIDQAFDQLTTDDLTAYLESVPSSSAYGGVSPARVGSQASITPSTRPTPSPSPRSRRRHLRQRILAAAGAAGGGGGSGGCGGSGGRGGRSTPGGRPGRGGGRLRRRPRRRQPSPSLPWSLPRPSQQATPRVSLEP